MSKEEIKSSALNGRGMRDYYVYALLLFFAVVNYISGYPGGMTTDSTDQFAQSINYNFNSHHPPIMSMLWSVFNHITQGPQLMLAFHIILLWSSTLIFYKTFKRKYPKLALLFIIIPLFPAILSQSTMIWKDISFSLTFLLVISIACYYTMAKEKPSILVNLFLLIMIFYGTGVKFQAKFITPIIILWLVWLNCKALIRKIVFFTVLGSSLVIGGNIGIIKLFSKESPSEQLRQIFDIAGISVITDQNLFPDFIKNNPLFSWEKVKQNYTPKLVNALVYTPDTKIFNMTNSQADIEELNRALFNGITRHPLAYLEHRFLNLRSNLKGKKYSHYAIVEEIHTQPYGVKNNNGMLKRIIVKYIKTFPVIFAANGFAFILVVVGICYLARIYYQGYFYYFEEAKVLLSIFMICLVFTITLFFTTMAADYRYYYIVRLLSYFSIPIIFMLRYNIRYISKL
ncbi:hypothetical protein H1Q59_00015 [Holosporaceae bacterium 'Namur']|nr:hypothetical protein [Holosporaceae bacterium 'Namur']